MSYTLYDATIVMVQHCVESVKCILQKGEAAPNAASLLEARIHEDMLPLSFQVHMVTSLSEKVLANLLGREPMKLENNFKTFDDMYKRIAVVSEVLAKADRDTINGRDGQTVKFDMGPKAVEISTLGYVNGVVLPNILLVQGLRYPAQGGRAAGQNGLSQALLRQVRRHGGAGILMSIRRSGGGQEEERGHV